LPSIAGIRGYCDDLYFRKVFKAAERVAPGEYRKLQQEQ
jgi:YesN/AraC family two-component response regulator